MNSEKEEEKLAESKGSVLDCQDNLGNSCLIQAIIDISQGLTKTNLAKEIIKTGADFTIQNKQGNNALHVTAELGNAEILGMLVMKMLNDELDNQLIGKELMTSETVLKLRNNNSEDVLMTAISAKSKECINILIDIGNVKITKEHLHHAKEYINDNSKVYSLLKKRYFDNENIEGK